MVFKYRIMWATHVATLEDKILNWQICRKIYHQRSLVIGEEKLLKYIYKRLYVKCDEFGVSFGCVSIAQFS